MFIINHYNSFFWQNSGSHFSLALDFSEIIKDINTGKTTLLDYPTIAIKVREYEAYLKEIENGIKNIDDKIKRKEEQLHLVYDEPIIHI